MTYTVSSGTLNSSIPYHTMQQTQRRTVWEVTSVERKQETGYSLLKFSDVVMLVVGALQCYVCW